MQILQHTSVAEFPVKGSGLTPLDSPKYGLRCYMKLLWLSTSEAHTQASQAYKYEQYEIMQGTTRGEHNQGKTELTDRTAEFRAVRFGFQNFGAVGNHDFKPIRFLRCGSVSEISKPTRLNTARIRLTTHVRAVQRASVSLACVTA